MAELLIPSHSKEPDTICGHAQRGTAQRQAGVALTCAILQHARSYHSPVLAVHQGRNLSLRPCPSRQSGTGASSEGGKEDTNRAAMPEKFGSGGPSVSRQSGARNVSTTNLPRSPLET